MKFELIPILDRMIDFYHQPRSFERFKEYLYALQGDTKGDLVLPISGFNPMAKEHIPQKLIRLKDLNAEAIAQQVMDDINARDLIPANQRVIRVALTLADDLKGGWTNRYTTDYDSKFKLNALVNRNFCVPYFWSSEEYSTDMIKLRIAEHLFRTLYRMNYPQPNTLREHVQQELFVTRETNQLNGGVNSEWDRVHLFYLENMESDQYNLIFNFFLW